MRDHRICISMSTEGGEFVKHSRFDCLLVDIQLGRGISGFELSYRLAAVRSTTPVIHISSHDYSKTRDMARTTRCFAFGSKLVTGEVLLMAVADACDLKRGQRVAVRRVEPFLVNLFQRVVGEQQDVTGPIQRWMEKDRGPERAGKLEVLMDPGRGQEPEHAAKSNPLAIGEGLI